MDTTSQARRIAYKQRLVTLGLLPLCYKREIKDLVFFFKALCGHIDLDVHSFVSSVNNGRTRLSVNPKHFNPHISTGLSSYGTTSAKFSQHICKAFRRLCSWCILIGGSGLYICILCMCIYIYVRSRCFGVCTLHGTSYLVCAYAI